MDAFLLKKVISNAVHIVPAAFFLLLLATLMLRWSPKLARSIILLTTISLLAFSSAPVSNLAVGHLENQHEVLQKLPDDTALILVLGSGHNYSTNRPPNSVLSSTALARISEGVRLWKTKPNARLLLSGAKFANEISHAEAMRNVALQMGVDEAMIVLASNAMDTADEIQAATSWLDLNFQNSERLVVVSSAMHLPRASFMLKGVTVEYSMAPTDFRMSTASWYRLTAGHLRNVDAAMHEYVGMLWHHLASR